MYSIISEIENLIIGMKNKTILTPDGEYYSSGTIRGWETNSNSIAEFISTSGVDENISGLNFRWAEDYRLYLLNKGYAKNSISQKLSIVKALAKRLYRDERIKYDGSGIRCGMETTTAVFVTIDEIKILLELDLSTTPGLERIRDIFVCQCFLGLRVGDMMRFLQKSKLYLKCINGKQFFELKTNKTQNTVVIPASTIVLQLCEKRNYEWGGGVTQQYYHRTIREIIPKTEIERDIIYNRTEGGERIERVVKFSSIVGTHTARRTFATNSYLAGINPLDIMKITGHKSFNSFYKYIRCENTQVALRLAEHEFFNLEF